MSKDGYIYLDRKITENWVWQRADYAFAWIDLIFLVNHSDNDKVPFDGKFTSVKRGQCITSIGKLSERWNCSKDKVRAILGLFEQDNMIVRDSNNRRTLLTIVKYDDYQDKSLTESTTKPTTKPTAKPITNSPTVAIAKPTTHSTTHPTTKPTQTINDKEMIINEKEMKKEKAALQPNPFGFEWE